MFTKTKIAFAAALILGTASAALANDSGENNQGGFAMPGSTAGVNPAYHPELFGNAGNVDKAGKAGKAYGYVASPNQQKDLSQSRK
jgi:hypothetical protein